MENKQTVFRKVKVSDIHLGKWVFYLTPTGFKGYGMIEKPSVVQGLYRCNDTYASHVLEEVEFPADDELTKMALGQYTIEDYHNDESGFIKEEVDRYKRIANSILNKIR